LHSSVKITCPRRIVARAFTGEIRGSPRVISPHGTGTRGQFYNLYFFAAITDRETHHFVLPCPV